MNTRPGRGNHGAADKAALRQQHGKRRDALSAAAQRAASLALASLALPLLRRLQARRPAACHVATYAAQGSEIDPQPLLLALGEQAGTAALRPVYPRMLPAPGAPRVMCFARADRGLVPGYGGILEPPATAPAVAPATLLCVLVPGLAFDRDGVRLGRGAGHYDRALLQLPPEIACLGLTHACGLVDCLPRQAHDILMHAVISDAEVIRCRLATLDPG